MTNCFKAVPWLILDYKACEADPMDLQAYNK